MTPDQAAQELEDQLDELERAILSAVARWPENDRLRSLAERLGAD